MCHLCCAPIFTSSVAQHNLCGMSAGRSPEDFVTNYVTASGLGTRVYDLVFTTLLIMFQHRLSETYRYTDGDFGTVWKLEFLEKTLHTTLDKVLASDFDDFSYISAYVVILSECSHLSFRRIPQRLVPLCFSGHFIAINPPQKTKN